MAMTFKQWQATRKWCEDLNAAECYWHGPGFIYNECDFVAADLIGGFGGFVVPITNTEARFDDFSEAERYLWEEWAKGEIGEAA